MTAETLYCLADTTAVEALVDSWVAWPHTFSPVVYSLHLLNYQKKTLSSYVQNPELHLKSSANPKLLGGAFVNIPMAQQDAVKDLLARIDSEHSDDLKLAQDLIQVQNMLDSEAVGQSLEPYYAQLPDSLKGRVELLYDYHSHPIVRCIEPLFYHSSYYKPHLQALRLFAQTHDRARAYYMSTPRLPDASSITWQKPFASPELDDLFKLDSTPQPLDTIRRLLGVSPDQDPLLLSLLSARQPAPVPAWQGPGIRLRYFGHACVLLETNGVAILIDPFIAVRPSWGGIERYSFQDLPPHIDYVLITHAHHDHFVFESLLRLRHKIGCLLVPKSTGLFYGDVSLVQMARALGFATVQEVDALDTVPIPNGAITAVPFLGEHNDLPFAKTGYLVRADHKQVLFAADSNCLDPHIYTNLCREHGEIDVVMLGMECVGAPLSWVYGPLLPKLPDYKQCQSRRSKGSDAVAALRLLQAVHCRHVYIYAIGREPWLQYFMALEPEEDDVYMQEINTLVQACLAQGLATARRLYGKDDIVISSD